MSKDVCAICTEEYDVDRRRIVLPCEHCICVDCICNLISEDDDRCPFCRRAYDLDILDEFGVRRLIYMILDDHEMGILALYYVDVAKIVLINNPQDIVAIPAGYYSKDDYRKLVKFALWLDARTIEFIDNLEDYREIIIAVKVPIEMIPMADGYVEIVKALFAQPEDAAKIKWGELMQPERFELARELIERNCHVIDWLPQKYFNGGITELVEKATAISSEIARFMYTLPSEDCELYAGAKVVTFEPSKFHLPKYRKSKLNALRKYNQILPVFDDLLNSTRDYLDCVNAAIEGGYTRVNWMRLLADDDFSQREFEDLALRAVKANWQYFKDFVALHAINGKPSGEFLNVLCRIAIESEPEMFRFIVDKHLTDVEYNDLATAVVMRKPRCLLLVKSNRVESYTQLAATIFRKNPKNILWIGGESCRRLYLRLIDIIWNDLL